MTAEEQKNAAAAEAAAKGNTETKEKREKKDRNPAIVSLLTCRATVTTKLTPAGKISPKNHGDSDMQKVEDGMRKQAQELIARADLLERTRKAVNPSINIPTPIGSIKGLTALALCYPGGEAVAGREIADALDSLAIQNGQ